MIRSFINRLWRIFYLPLFDIFFFLRSKWKSSRKIDEGKGKVILTKFDAIGDYLLVRNFFEELKADSHWGHYHLTLVGNELWAELVKSYDDSFIDEFVFISPEKFKKEFFYRFKTLWSLQGKSYEILLAPTLSRKFLIDESISLAIRAKKKITQKSDCLNMKPPLAWIGQMAYHEIYNLKPKETLFEFLRNREYFENFLGKKLNGLNSNFTKYLKRNESIPRRYPFKYVVFVPGAGQESRRWPVLNFIRLGRFILDQTPFHILLVGAKSEIEIGREIQNRLNGPQKVFNSMGKYTMSDIVPLIHHCEFVISNETGIVHFAAALGKWVFCPSNGQHYGRFHPYPEELTKPSRYLYPTPLEEQIKKISHHDDFQKLANQFNRTSPHSIDDVSAERMISMIKEIIFST